MTPQGRILIVDDNEMNLDILRRLLRKQYELESAQDGEECLCKVAEFRPQLVLLDIMMPVMDGYEACRRIKHSTVGEFVQVILVSGKGSAPERLQGYESMADDYIVKPFDHGELISKVRVQFRLWEAQQALHKANQELELYTTDLERLVAERSRQLTATQDMTVFALAKLAESRDPETGEHLERMRFYACLLGQELAERGPYADQIDAEFLDNLYRASPLHDIGKVGVPDSVLLKAGPLSDDEWELMKQHVVHGARTLEEACQLLSGDRSFLDMAIDIARYHHERFDGLGYPGGLRGEAIPLSARIVALADAFDAITSPRVYKLAESPTVACERIEADSGRHFDPAVVRAFLDRYDDFVDVQRRLGETDEAPLEAVAS